nr:DNA helicase [Tanacetum cinerariifolium]
VMAASVISISLDSFEGNEGSHVLQVNLFGVIPAIIYVIPVVPAEDSFPLTPELPLISPFFCSDDLEADSESEPAQHRPNRLESLTVLDAMVLRWRDRVACRPSLLSGSSSHNTLAPSSEFPLPYVVAPSMIRRWLAILIRHDEAIPFDRHSSPDFTSDSSSCGSSLDFSSATSLGSPSDSLSDTSSVHSSGCDASAPTLVDLLPPCKRFRYSYSLKDSKEEHMEIDTADAEAVVDLGISDEVRVDTEDGIGSLCPPEGESPWTVREKYLHDEVSDFTVRLYNVIGTREYEHPTGDLLGAIVYEVGSKTEMDYDIIIEQRSEYEYTAFCAIEQNIIAFIREHQNGIKNEYLSGIYDAIIHGNNNGYDIGGRLIRGGSAPTSHPTSSPLLTIYRVHGNPSFFITFTCNIKWLEIVEYMKDFPGLTTTNQADVVDTFVIRLTSKSVVSLIVIHLYGLMKVCDGEVPEFLQEMEKKKNKRYKSTDSSSFNMRELREESINLNNTVGYEEDEVEKVRRSHPIRRDQANRKVKAGSTATNSFDVDWDSSMSWNSRLRRLKNCQRDEALYESTTDEDLKAILRQRLFG